MTIGVVVGTFGEQSWDRRGEEVCSSLVGFDEQIHVHGTDLADARNRGAEYLSTDWLIFCDADDRLDPGYADAMRDAIGVSNGTDGIYKPITQGLHPDGLLESPSMIPERDLYVSNHIVIGAMMLRERFLAVGGFNPALPILEDWDLWLRLYETGSEIITVPAAIYVVGISPNGRNMNPSHGKWVQDIRRTYGARRPR